MTYDDEKWNKIKDIFDATLRLEPDQRQKYLRSVCGNDIEIYREVESLLSSYNTAESFLENHPIGAVADVIVEENKIEKSLDGHQINQYKIIYLIGKGGMGEVYLARDTSLERKVAIKFLSDEFRKDTEKLNRFIQEAKAASALNHPNILTVHEINESDGMNYIASEFIEGKTLREHLLQKESISLDKILSIGTQIAEALSAAHQAGIIHRDIKPENIMIRKDGYLKVLDFGLAKLTEKKNPEFVLPDKTTEVFVKTNPGMILGTVSYMSPEQARGKEIDERTDIWSLGIVLYEMLSGKVPFEGETVNHTIVAILENEPLLLENVPDELQRIVRKALNKDKEMRYQTVRDLLIDFKNLKRSLDIQGELERTYAPNKEEKTKSFSDENKTTIIQNAATTLSFEKAIAQVKNHKMASAIIGIIFLAVLSVITYSAFFAASHTKQIESIAVMPFINESGNRDVEYLSDGMTETLISSISRIPNLSVKSSSSAFRYKGKEVFAKKVGEELNVEAILFGKVFFRNDEITLNLELVDSKIENVLWKRQYVRKMSDLALLQNEIAKNVSDELRSTLSREDEKEISKGQTNNPEAYQAYLKGRFLWNQRAAKSYWKALEHFKRSVEIDSNFALGYTGIADTYYLLNQRGELTSSEAFPNAEVAARKALELDPTLAEAHAALGVINVLYYKDWVKAEDFYKRAIELNPNYAEAHARYGFLLNFKGKFDEAYARLKEAERLDPTSLNNGTYLGLNFYFSRQYDRALEQFNKVLELSPNYRVTYYYFVALIYEQKGMYEKAVETDLKGRSYLNPQTVEPLRQAYQTSGIRSFWQKQIELLKNSKKKWGLQRDIVSRYVLLGEFDKAIAYIEKSANEDSRNFSNEWIGLNVDPVFSPLQSHPKFKELLRKLNLSD